MFPPKKRYCIVNDQMRIKKRPKLGVSLAKLKQYGRLKRGMYRLTLHNTQYKLNQKNLLCPLLLIDSLGIMDKAHNLWPLGKNSLTKTFRDTRKPTPSPPSAKSPERWNVHSSLLASSTVILDSANFWWVSDRQTTPSLFLSEWNRSC